MKNTEIVLRTYDCTGCNRIVDHRRKHCAVKHLCSRLTEIYEAILGE